MVPRNTVHKDVAFFLPVYVQYNLSSELTRIYRSNQMLEIVKTGIFCTLCYINLNMTSIIGKGNFQTVFKLDTCYEASVV